ncbi:hypothetical protein LPB140_07645 [Sphingorhabdus lutea]|uniref:Apple domain-containing protein n=1 Tax=Sphingorhabdus lutea TaxID=1913578 RepID=A0A1L3JC18_9SPHN|nr:PAN domain-containing protein [Sphingorhabdus lutea]APG62684.1 hypothetical protein LPB140_07645 [Sphingorhabdus lutea]
MKTGLNIYKGLAIIALFSGTLAIGQSSILTLEQRISLYGPDHLRAGIYSIAVVNTDLCLEQKINAAWPQQPHITAQTCNIRNNLQHFVIIPTIQRNDSYTIRPLVGNGDATRLKLCATTASKSIGPNQINLRECNGNTGQEQIYNFVASGNSNHSEIREAKNSGAECWSIRGGNLNIGSDVVKWACHHGADQNFAISYIGPVLQPVEPLAFNAVQYYFAAGIGYRRLSKTASIDLPGGDMISFETIEDKGEYCAARCHSDINCKAYTWKSAGLDTVKPICYLKNIVPQPVNRGAENQDDINSAIMSQP